MSNALTLSYWIYALLLACLAVCWADVLVRPGMVLAPAQAWVRERWRTWERERLLRYVFKEEVVPDPQELENTRSGLNEYASSYGLEIDARWWWKPLWGCAQCIAGQWGFWGYLLLFPLSAYHLLAHLGFTAVTLILSIIVQKWSQQ